MGKPIGLMVNHIKVIIRMIKNMDMVYLVGRMVNFMRVNGSMGNNMVRVYYVLMERREKEFGRMEKEFS